MQARSIVAAVAAGVTTVGLAVVGPTSVAHADPPPTEPYYRAVPTALAFGTDGNVWFVAGSSVGKLEPDGDITSYLLDYRAETTDVVANIAGVWFTADRSIGKLSYDGELTSYRSGLSADPKALTTAPDGTVWFGGDGGRVGKISSAGVITEYVITTAAGNPYRKIRDLAVAGDDTVWLSVSEPGADEYQTLESLVRISATGDVLARLPRLDYSEDAETGSNYPSLIRGADDAVWYQRSTWSDDTLESEGVVGRLTGSTFGASWNVRANGQLALGSDDALWFGAWVGTSATLQLGRLTTAGTLTTFDTPIGNYYARRSFIGDPDAKLWLGTNNGIASLTLDGELDDTFAAPYEAPTVASVVARATTARVSWSASGGPAGETSYVLEAEPDTHRYTSTALTTTLTGLDEARSYLLTVRARGPAGTGLPGSAVFTTQPQRAAGPAADFSGDGRAEIAVFRPGNGTWYIRGRGTVVYGADGDIPVPADYVGDRRAEVAVFRPSNGTWYVSGWGAIAYGAAGDIPVPADYNGDGRVDIAVFRPSNGTWYIRGRGAVTYGAAGDIPVPGNYFGDRRADLVVWRASNRTWYRRGDAPVRFGAAGDRPLILDRDGDGRTEIAVYRPSTGEWLTRTSEDYTDGQQLPLPGRYDARRGDDLAGFDPWFGSWELYEPEDANSFVDYGQNGDIPV